MAPPIMFGFFIGAALGQALLASLLYWGTGNTDAPYRKAMTVGVFVTLLSILGDAFGNANGGPPDFQMAFPRAVVGLLLCVGDLLRIRSAGPLNTVGQQESAAFMENLPRPPPPFSVRLGQVIWWTFLVVAGLAVLVLGYGASSNGFDPGIAAFASACLSLWVALGWALRYLCAGR
ncbi:hypothetical protein [Aestuariivirga sp.]|uniref:hypothetical protein n=1 Tax=Aestuariivirga sp. TaxID=2650926 RepID=UPI0039E23083